MRGTFKYAAEKISVYGSLPEGLNHNIRMQMNLERFNILAGCGQDLPCVVLYVTVIAMGYTVPAFIIGGFVSSMALGYKISSVEKFGIWTKMKNMGYGEKLVANCDKSQ